MRGPGPRGPPWQHRSPGPTASQPSLLTPAATHGTEVTVTVGRAGSDLVLTVQDDGPGIPPADRAPASSTGSPASTKPAPAAPAEPARLAPSPRDLATSHGGTLTAEEPQAPAPY
ncbi:ATP-binding protein [Streptomyces hydrogenans]|uniref:ATP-binding protein n=1 Tax=Streptomyces hydrogenans TaxID=1873719 RepID=UPI0035590A13